MFRLQKVALKRDLVVVSQFNIVEQLTNNNPKESFTLNEILRNICVAIEIEDIIDDIIIPSNNNTNLQLLADVLMFMLTNTYGFNENIKDIVISREELEQFSISLNDISLLYGKLTSNDIIQKNINSALTIDVVFNYFQEIENKYSDKNYFVKELITFVNSTTKYDDYMISGYGKVNITKNTLNAIKETIFPKIPFKSSFKLISITLHGITSTNTLEYTNKSILNDCEFINFASIYTTGVNLYLSKIIVSIMRVYEYIYKRNDNEILDELINIIANDNYSLSEKYDNSLKLLYVKYQLKTTLKDFIEDTYFIPVYVEDFVNDTTNYTLDELKEKEKEIESKYKKSIEEIIIVSLFNTNPVESINKIIELNKKIENNIKIYVEEYPDVLGNLLKELNTSLVATLMVQLLSFPESLGKYLIEAGTQVLNTVPPSMPLPDSPDSAPEITNCNAIVSDLRNSSGIFAINTVGKVINYGFCKVKDALKIQDNKLVQTLENYVLNKFQ